MLRQGSRCWRKGYFLRQLHGNLGEIQSHDVKAFMKDFDAQIGLERAIYSWEDIM